MLPADLVVCAVGVRPNAALARAAALDVNRGVLVDDGLARPTRRPRHRRMRRASRRLLRPRRARLRAGGRAGARLAGDACDLSAARCSPPISRFRASACSRPATSRAGRGRGPRASPTRRPAPTAGSCCSDGRLVGAVLFGDTHGRALVPRPHPHRRDVAAMRDRLVFGRALAPRQRAEREADMGDDFTPDQKRYLEGFVSGVQAAGAQALRRSAGRRAGAGRAARGAGRDPPGGAGPHGRGGQEARRPGEVEARGAPLRRLSALQGAGRRPTSFPSPPTISAGATTACSTSRPRRTATCAACASPTAS